MWAVLESKIGRISTQLTSCLMLASLVTVTSSAETCTAYTDGTGYARPAFDCETYCCGTSTLKYCCTEYCYSTYFSGSTPCITEEDAWNSVLMIAGILAGVGAAAVVFIVLAVVCESLKKKTTGDDLEIDNKRKERPTISFEAAEEPVIHPEPEPEQEEVPEPEPEPEAAPEPEPVPYQNSEMAPKKKEPPLRKLVRRNTLPPIPGPKPVGEAHPQAAMPVPTTEPRSPTPPQSTLYEDDVFGAPRRSKYTSPRADEKEYVKEALDY
ncbi:protein shisa-4-like [Lineus longissimus]|uniref:protein shisa-4-like n=1 Tax=Lineus longissimus TaxID=88925 RepID=UPI002B4C3B32